MQINPDYIIKLVKNIFKSEFICIITNSSTPIIPFPPMQTHYIINEINSVKKIEKISQIEKFGCKAEFLIILLFAYKNSFLFFLH